MEPRFMKYNFHSMVQCAKHCNNAIISKVKNILRIRFYFIFFFFQCPKKQSCSLSFRCKLEIHLKSHHEGLYTVCSSLII